MSMVRTGHKPEDWRDEGASSALIRHRTYAVVPAEVIGSMRPVIRRSPETTERLRQAALKGVAARRAS